MKTTLISILAFFAFSAHAAEPMHNYRVENHQFRMEFLDDFYQAVGYTPPAAAAYISANGTSWSPWTSVIAGGQIGYTPTNKVALYCQATATSAWAPCNPGGGTAIPSGPAGGDLSGTYPNPNVVKSVGTFTVGTTLFVDQINAKSVGQQFGTYNPAGNQISRNVNDAIAASTVNNASTASTAAIQNYQKAGTTVAAITNNGSYSGPQVITPPETVTFLATPTFSATAGMSRIVLTADVTSSTLAAGADGAEKRFQICQDATGLHLFAWPSNVKGGMTISPTASTCNWQTFTYSTASGYAFWYATSPGVIAQ